MASQSSDKHGPLVDILGQAFQKLENQSLEFPFSLLCLLQIWGSPHLDGLAGGPWHESLDYRDDPSMLVLHLPKPPVVDAACSYQGASEETASLCCLTSGSGLMTRMTDGLPVVHVEWQCDSIDSVSSETRWQSKTVSFDGTLLIPISSAARCPVLGGAGLLDGIINGTQLVA